MTGSEERGARRSFRLLLSRATLLILLGLVIAFSFREIYSPDIGFHLRAGEWILEHLKFPGKDMFTYTAGMNDYVDTYWLYQVQVAAIHKLSGEFGLVLFSALIVAACFAVALLRCYRRRAIDETPYWQVLVLLAILAAAFLFETRPHSFSWLYLGLTLLILEEASERGKKTLVFLPIVMLVWANTHTLFILGWIVIASTVLGVAWRDRKIWSPLTVYGILAILIPLVNPYGVAGVELPFEQIQFLQSHSAFKTAITEYISPLDLQGYVANGRFVLLQPLLGFHLFLIISACVFLGSLKRVQLHQVIIFLLLGYIGLQGVKNIGYFVFAVLPWTINGFQSTNTGVPNGALKSPVLRAVADLVRRSRSAGFQTVLNTATIAVSLILIQAVVTNVYYLNYRSNDRFGFRYNDHTLPVKAAEFLRQNNLDGRILNQFNFGGFLIGAIPQKIFIDGRTEVMGENLFAEYCILWNAIDKRPLLEKYNPDIVIVPHQSEFLWVHYMRRNTQWRLVYFDELAAIYLRRGYADSVGPIDASEMLGAYQRIGGSRIDSVLRRRDAPAISLFSFRERYFPQKEIGLSTFCYYDDAFDAAIQFGLNGLLLSTVPCPEVYYDLGHNFFERKDFNRAAYCYERFLETNADPLARERLTRIRAGSLRSFPVE